MSQFFVNSGGGGGGNVNQVNTQSGNAIPINGILNFNGYDSTENNIFGITTKGNTDAGNPPGSGTGNEEDVYLTNRYHGSATTTDATPTTIATCPMTLRPAVYQFTVNLCLYDATNDEGASSVSVVTFRAVSPIGVPINLTPDDFIIQQDPGSLGSVDLQATSTEFRVIVTGAAATTIRWTCHGTYQVVN